MTVVPATTSAEEALALAPDGVFLSNGPGDPEPCDYAITAIQELLETGMPIFGICLGHQLLGLAAGGRTVKMKFGHHGANHPVQDLATGQVMITSQNHGFAVDEESLPENIETTHRRCLTAPCRASHLPIARLSVSRATLRPVPGRMICCRCSSASSWTWKRIRSQVRKQSLTS